MNNLKDTVELMESEDFKDRFRAEYFQLCIRIEKLSAMIDNYEALSFTPKTPKKILQGQLKSMIKYLEYLQMRAQIEDIDISE